MKAPERAAAAVAEAMGRALFGPVQAELDRVDGTIRQRLRSNSESVNRLVGYVSRFGGKKLRPAILLLSGRAAGGLREVHVSLGAVVEMIHIATLVHDDVLDHARTRRRLPSLNSLYGNHTPILLGDAIYATAFTITTELEDRTASRLLARVTIELCSGEIEQNMNRGRLDLTLPEYLRIIEAKTASLLGMSARLGGHYAGASAEVADALEAYGRRLGVAFQIIDDCLDLEGDEDLVGKSLGTDLEEGKMTLPLIRLVARLGSRDRERLRRLLEDPDVGDRRRALQESFDLEPELQASREIAEDSIRRAVTKLRVLPRGEARDALTHIAEYVVQRDR